VRVWDALDFQEIAVLKGHRGTVTFVTCAPDGALIASCSYDHTVRLWSSTTLQEAALLEGHGDAVWSVAFSLHSTRLVSTSDDETVRVWDTVNCTQLAQLGAPHPDVASFFATFSLDGRTILTRLRDDGPIWVRSDEDDGDHSHHVHDA
jgi:WD40 repeat protein